MPNDELISKLTPDDRAHIYAQEASRLAAEHSAARRIHTSYLIAIGAVLVLGSAAALAFHHEYSRDGDSNTCGRSGQMRMLQRGENTGGANGGMRRGLDEKGMFNTFDDTELQRGRMDRLAPTMPQFEGMQPGRAPLSPQAPTPPNA